MADPVLYNHRGTNPYIDNSIESYKWGFSYGGDYAETDFRLTKDGVVISYHDDLDGGIANLTYAEVKARVPSIVTLGELIELAKQMEIDTGRTLGILIENKAANNATAEAIIQTLIAHDYTDPQHLVFQSFGSELPYVRDTLFPKYGVDIPLVQLTGSALTAETIAYYATYADGVAPTMASLTPELVAAAHAAGLTVNGWTVDGTEADVRNALALGVDGIINDNTQWSRPALEKLLRGVNVAYGSEQWDVVNGYAGADKLYGMEGNDILRAGAGNDVLYGDAGNDLLFGGAGDDQLLGGSGDDFLSGGEGTDVLDGGAGNDVIVATGDRVVFRAGNGIDLISLDKTSTIVFDGVAPASIRVIRDGNNLIIRSGSDALVLLDGVDPAHQPASIKTADGLTLTGAQLAALAVPGTDAEVAALMPGFLAVLAGAPAFATASTIAVGTDLVAEGDFGSGVLTQHIEGAETGAIYRLSFSLADLPTGNDGVRVLWGGQVIYEGVPAGTGSDLHFIVKGGAGNGSNELVFEGMGQGFGATLDDVHLVKISEAALPASGNVAPTAPDADIQISQNLPFYGKVSATDANGDALTYSLGEGPAHGTLVLKPNGAYRYTPNAGFTGADGFTVLVNDGHGGIVETSIDLTVAQGVLLGTDLIVNGSFEDISVNGSFEAVPGQLSSAWWGYYADNGVIAGWTDINGNRAEVASAPENQNYVQPKDGAFFFDLDGYGKLSAIGQVVKGVEQGATYELKFSIADGDARTDDDGVQVLWGGQVVFEGMPGSNAWTNLSLTLTGGSGDGSNKLVFKGTGFENWFGVQLDDVRLVKIAEAGAALPANHAPAAVDGTAQGVVGTVITGSLAASDADGDATLIFNLADGPSHGTVKVYTDGTYSYTPTAGFSGEDSFSFTVSDGRGGTDTATLNLSVTPRERIAIGTDLIVNGSFEDTSESSGNNGPSDWGYRNLDGQLLGWTNTANKRIEQHWDHYGGVTAKDGKFWIDMDSSNLASRNRIGQSIADVESGATYRISFSLSDSDNVRNDDGVRVLWNGVVIFEGVPPQTSETWATYSFDVVGGSGDGSNRLEFMDTGAPDSWGAGAALDDVHFVKVADAPVNAAPVAGDDADFVTPYGESLTITAAKLLANDRDADGDTLVIASLTSGPGGTVSLDANGNIVFKPTTGYSGDASFSYVVADGHGGTDTATVRLTIAPMPSVAVGTDLIVNGSFEDISESGNYNGGTDWGYRNNDKQIVGWTNVNRIEQHLDNYGGVHAKDGTFWIDLDSSNLAQRNKLGQDIAHVEAGATYRVSFSLSDSDNVRMDDGVTVLWNGQVIFSGLPPQTSAGWVTLSFDVVGGSGNGSNRLEFVDTGAPDSWGAGVALDDVHFVKVANVGETLPTNHAPEAAKGAAQGVLNTVVTGQLTASDQDTGASLFYSLGTGAAHGTVLVYTDGTYRYTPATGFTGTDSFTFTVNDGRGGRAEATVNLTIAPPNTAPVAADDAGLGTQYGTALTVAAASLLANDRDADGDALTIRSVANGTGGTVALDEHGNVVFTPAAGFEGDASFTYVVSDGKGGTASATVIVTVAPQPQAGVGTPGDDELAGTPGNDTMHAGAGDDVVLAGAGDDTVDGGEGDDTLDGGAGNDLLIGGEGDDALFGGEGDDVLKGGAGDDLLDGGAGLDTADYSDDTAGVTVDLSAGTASGEEAGEDELVSIEAVIGGAGDDVLIGDAGDNRLLGGLGDDLLQGGAGNDVLDGGAGNDVIEGGAGNDLILAGAGDDVIDGGEGFDTLDLSAATGPVTVDFGAGKVSGEGIGSDSFRNIEKLLFGAGNDVVTGGNGDDAFDGGAGNDTLKGGAGDDKLWGGAGDDMLDGGSGDDAVYGGIGNDQIKAGSGNDLVDAGEGNDVIDAGSGDDIVLAGSGNDVVDGGSGNDRIEGGAGDDILTGGSGHDVFVFAAGFGKDTITDFKTTGSSSDVIEFATDVFADFEAAIEAAHQVGSDTVFTVDSETSLTLKNVQLASLHTDDFRFV